MALNRGLGTVDTRTDKLIGLCVVLLQEDGASAFRLFLLLALYIQSSCLCYLRMLISVFTVSRALDCHSELVCRRIDFDWFSF